MLKPLLEAVFEELKREKIIRTQSEFAEQLGITKGHMSTLIKQTGEVPPKIRTKLNEKFGISLLWLISGGRDGAMFVFDKPNIVPPSEKEPIISKQKVNEQEYQYKTQNIDSQIDVSAKNLLSSIPLNKIDMLEQQNFLLAQALANITETNRRLADGLLGVLGKGNDADKDSHYPPAKAV